MIDYAHMSKFLEGSTDKQLTLSWGRNVYRNSGIAMESMEITESLCSEESLRFGSCESNVFKIRIKAGTIPLINEVLSVSMMIDDLSPVFTFGKYTVVSEVKTADKGWKDIEAYDLMYNILNADVTEWYNSLTFPMTLLSFRNSFFSRLGIVHESKILVNDSAKIEKTIFANSGITGKMVVTAICEINGVFGKIGRNNVFRYVDLADNYCTVYPSARLKSGVTIYPSSVYPGEQIEKDNIDINRYKELQLEEYKTKKYTGVSIRYEDGDIGATSGTTENAYVITDNFLMYGKSSGELSQIASRMFSKIKSIEYIPFSMEMRGNPCIEVGDFVDIVDTNGDTTTTVVLERTLRGIQALMDSVGAHGTEEAEELESAVDMEIKHLKGKSNVLERSIEETTSRITNVEEGLQSQITQTAESIKTEVSKTYATKDYFDEIGITPPNMLIHSDLSYKDFNDSYELTNATINNESALISIGVAGKVKYVLPIPIEAGTTYCLSFMVEKSNVTSVGTVIGTFRYVLENADGVVTPMIQSQIKFAGTAYNEVVFTPLVGYTTLKYFEIEAASGVSIVINRLKLEKGQKHTDWVPNAQDYATGQVNALRVELSSKIDQTAESITSEVAETITKWDTEDYDISFYGYGVPSDDGYTTADLNKYYLDVQTGKLYRYIHYGTATTGFNYWSNPKDFKTTEEIIKSEIEQTKNSVAIRVENGNVHSELNVDENGLGFVGNRVVIEAENFKLDEEGNATFTGKVNSSNVNVKDSMSLSIGSGGEVNIVKGIDKNPSGTEEIRYIFGAYENEGAPTLELVDNEEVGAVAISNADEFFVKTRDGESVIEHTYNESYEQNVLTLPNASIGTPFVVEGRFDLQGSSKLKGGGNIKQSGIFVTVYGHVDGEMSVNQRITLNVDYMFDLGQEWDTMPKSNNERVRAVARIGDYTLILTLTEQGTLIVKNIGPAFTGQSFLFRFDYFNM